LRPDTNSAKFVGYAEKLAGDKVQAAVYYRLAISRVNPKQPQADYTIRSIQADLAEVTQ
jgi:hypothetical protein